MMADIRKFSERLTRARMKVKERIGTENVAEITEC